MRRYMLAAGLAALLAFPAAALAEAGKPAPSGNYVSDITHTSLTWRIGHFGLSHYTARFARADAQLGWNLETPERSTLSVTIDPASVRTDFPFPEKEDFDRKIATAPEFLAGEPIRFVSRHVEKTGDNTGRVTGDLTFRGRTQPFTLDVVYNGSMEKHPHDGTPKIGFSAKGSVKRSEWGMDFAIPALDDAVEVIVETEFMPAPK